MNSSWFRAFSFAAPITLPVKMKTFNAVLRSNSRVDLSWTTAEEVNLNHFVVERSLDGEHFTDAGMVFSNGAAGSETFYSFPDNISGLNAKVIYYRLRSVDTDAKFQYSATRLIRLNQDEQGIRISSFPNPVTNELRVSIPASWQSKPVVYEIFTLTGSQVLRTQNMNSSQVETINLSNLRPGAYLVKATCEGVSAHQKIIKQ
jgi:hypothetical protein